MDIQIKKVAFETRVDRGFQAKALEERVMNKKEIEQARAVTDSIMRGDPPTLLEAVFPVAVPRPEAERAEHRAGHATNCLYSQAFGTKCTCAAEPSAQPAGSAPSVADLLATLKRLGFDENGVCIDCGHDACDCGPSKSSSPSAFLQSSGAFSGAVEKNEREKFEKWVAAMEPAYADSNLERLTGGRGGYRVHNVACWWMAWQARAALGAAPANLDSVVANAAGEILACPFLHEKQEKQISLLAAIIRKAVEEVTKCG